MLRKLGAEILAGIAGPDRRRWTCAIVLAGIGVSALLTACGGGDSSAPADAPSRVAVTRCLEHGGTAGPVGVLTRERHAEIGGLPAHVEMTAEGFRTTGHSITAVTLALFKTTGEAEEAVPILEAEEPSSTIHAYADGSVVGIVSGANGGTVLAKDEALLEACGDGDEGALKGIEDREVTERKAAEKQEATERRQEATERATAERSAAACLEEAGVAVVRQAADGYEEVAGTARDGGFVGILLLEDPGRASKAIAAEKQALGKERPGALVITGTAQGGHVVTVTAGTGSGNSTLASAADEELVRRCAAGGG